MFVLTHAYFIHTSEAFSLLNFFIPKVQAYLREKNLGNCQLFQCHSQYIIFFSCAESFIQILPLLTLMLCFVENKFAFSSMQCDQIQFQYLGIYTCNNAIPLTYRAIPLLICPIAYTSVKVGSKCCPKPEQQQTWTDHVKKFQHRFQANQFLSILIG